LAAGADVITLPKVSMRRWILGATYNVTDASVAANQDFEGWIDSVQIVADGKTIFRADTNELRNVCKLLAPYGTDSLTDNDQLDNVPGLALLYDGLPTTAEDQRVWYVFNMPHDLRMYSDVEARISWRAATAEWDTPASAFTAKIWIAIHHGNVSRSLGVIRVPSSTSTEHNIPMGDYPVIAGVLTPGTVEYITEVKLKGKDGQYDVAVNEPVALMAMYGYMEGLTPASDSVVACYLPDLLVPYFPERRITVSCSTTTTIVAHYVSLFGNQTIKPQANKGDAKRGVAQAIATQYQAGAAARASTAQPATRLTPKLPAL
jgi:hypothetical protein